MIKNVKTPKKLTEYSHEELIALVQSLENEKASLEQQLKLYEEWIRLNREKKYGASSEKYMPGQLMLPIFNEPEDTALPLSTEPEFDVVVPATRKRPKGKKQDMLRGLPIEVVEYNLSDEERSCPACGEQRHAMSTEERLELKVIPAQISVVKHIRSVYSCRNCEKNATENQVITAPMPKAAFPKSLASPSLVSYLMDMKYVKAVPIYRMEQDFKRQGLMLSRQTMSNWMIKASRTYLVPLYERMHEILLTKQVVHADETEVEVLHEPGKEPSQKSYMWMYRTGSDSKPLVLYDYRTGRSGDYAKEFLAGFHGYLQVDGYAGYNKVDDVTLVGCFAHARRKFDETLKALPKEKATPEYSLAAKGFDYCNQLFAIEKKIETLSFEERYKERLEKSKPVLDEFFAWVEKLEDPMNPEGVLPKSSLGKAVGYASRQKEKLLAFLEDGRLELSNNRAERAIKPFVIGRRNWLFCNSQQGATASSVIYSIIETAKENEISPFQYLKYLFEVLPTIEDITPARIDELLPWSQTLPDICKAKITK